MASLRLRLREAGWGSLLGCLAFVAGVIRAEPLILCAEGEPRLPIVTGSVLAPADELSRYLRRITGADFEMRPAASGQSGIHVGLVKNFPGLKVERAEDLGPEGFVITTREGSLFLVGHGERGVQHAVTTFLQELGCRWFFPGEAWEVVPRLKSIVGEWNLRQVPSFPTQRRIWYGFGAYESGRRDHADWVRHNRMGGPIDIGIGHTWHGLKVEQDFDRHPEWFALVDGRRQPSKPCYSHPEVLRRAIESALKQAEAGRMMVSMTPPDGLGYCECERCREVCRGAEPFEDHGLLFARRADGELINVTSETLFSFINQVAAAVSEKYPETLIGCYAYSAYSHPPAFDLHPNVYLQTTTAYRRTPITLEEQIKAFGRKTTQVGIREYYSVYQWDWDYPNPGKMTPQALAKDLRFFHRHGVTAINAEASNNWGARGIGYYLASRLMWDVNAATDELLREFYRTCFGPAALPMQRYYVRWGGPELAVLKDPRGLPEQRTLYRKGTFDVESLRAAYRDLEEAVKLVPPDSDWRTRIDQLRMYAHYLTLRYRLHQAEQSGDPSAIIAAIKAETTFGGRLTHTHMIHTRPLLGKAFLRRFKRHEKLLEGVPEAREGGKGWRQIGEPPTSEELARLWEEDRQVLGLR